MSSLFDAVVEGNFADVSDLVQEYMGQGLSASAILEEHLLTAMGEVGRRFDEGEYFVPDLLMASKAMQEAMKVLDPILKGCGAEKRGLVIIGTVQGDMHDIGKNLVASMLEGNGFSVVDLGVNTSPDKFLNAVRESLEKGTPVVLLALSALLTTTMPQMKIIVDRLETEGLRDKVKVMVGGAPVSLGYSEEIGADGYSDSANSAVQLAIRLSA